MPSSPVHLYVARLIADDLNVNDTAQYLLGSIAPDSVNLEGFAPQEVRYEAHNRSLDLDEWKKKALSVYEDTKGRDKDFAKGVLVHILTDIFWDELIQPDMLSKLGQEGDGYEVLKDKKWQELYRFNTLITSKDWYPEVLDTLKDAKPLDYRNIDKEMMRGFRDYVCEDYADKLSQDRPRVLTEDTVIITAMATLGYIKENVNIKAS